MMLGCRTRLLRKLCVLLFLVEPATAVAVLTVQADAAPTTGDAPLTVDFAGSVDGCIALASDPIRQSTGPGNAPDEVIIEIENTSTVSILISEWIVETSNSNKLIDAVFNQGQPDERNPDAVSPAYGTNTDTFTLWFDDDGDPQNLPTPNPLVIPPGATATFRLLYDSPIASGTKVATLSLYDADDTDPAGDGVRNLIGTASTEQTETTYDWDFDDGDTSTERSPSHTYTAPGTYTAVFTSTCGAETASDTVEITVSGFDHYAVSFPNGTPGLTCEPVLVQITAHDASDNVVNVPGGTALQLTSVIDGTATATGSWDTSIGGGVLTGGPGNPVVYTWPAGIEESSFTIELRQLTPLLVDINVSDGVAVELEDPRVEFRDAVFRVVDGAANPVNITTKLSGKGSDVAGTGFQSLFLQAIETNSSRECQGVFENVSDVAVEFASECVVPGSCETVNARVVDDGGSPVAIARNDNGAVGAFTPVQLDFDTDSKTPLAFIYADAGQIRLHMRFDMDAPSGIYMTGSSNVFTVKPPGLCVESTDADSDCASGDATCTPFTPAGASFNLTVRGVTWEDDADADADFCAPSKSTTPNFELTNIALTQNLIAPAAGSAGSLGVNTVDIADPDKGVITEANQTLSEVGVFTITATAPAYLGDNIAPSTSANIGRFYPDHFNLANPVITNRSASGCAPLPAPQPTFTYMDEILNVAYDLEARNRFNDVTVNYTGAFALLPLNTASMAYGAVDTTPPTPTPLTLRLSFTSTTGAWVGGIAAVDSDFGVSRAAVVDGPYEQFNIGIAPVDPDLVAMNTLDLDVDDDSTDDHTRIGATAIRFGRLYIGTAFGSDLLPLNVPFEVEYYDGAMFIRNVQDNCTTIDDVVGDTAPDLILSNNVEATGQTDGTVLICAASTSTMTLGDNPVVAGNGRLVFSAPGADCNGFATISVDLGTPSPPGQNKAWLEFDWDDDGTFSDDPLGRVDFGIFEGSDALIYIREPWD
jgi:PKD repeat protein